MIGKCLVFVFAVFVAESVAAPCCLSSLLPSCLSASACLSSSLPLGCLPGAVPACGLSACYPGVVPSCLSGAVPALSAPACLPPPPLPLPIPACLPAAYPLQACMSSSCLPIC